MKVRFIQAIAGHADERYGLEDHSFRPGEVAEVDDALGQSWVDAGVAAAADEEAASETPDTPAPKAAAVKETTIDPQLEFEHSREGEETPEDEETPENEETPEDEETPTVHAAKKTVKRTHGREHKR